MKLQASKKGEWPKGLHWTAKEVREVDPPKGAELPAWLAPVKAKKRTTKAKEAK